MDKFAIIALVLCGMSAILDISGLAIPYWSYISSADSDNYSENYGLWSICRTGGGLSACFPWPEVPGVLAGVRAMVVLGLLLMIAAVVCFLLHKFMMKDMGVLTKVAAGLAIFAGILMLLGPVVYATNKTLNNPLVSLHAGFALCIVAAVFGIAGGVCMFLTKE